MVHHRLSSYPFNTACFVLFFSGTILQDIFIYSWLTSEQPHGRYRLQTVRSLAGVSLMLRLLWASLRWDDMAVKPSAAVGTTRTGTTDLRATAASWSLCLTFKSPKLLLFLHLYFTILIIYPKCIQHTDYLAFSISISC